MDSGLAIFRTQIRSETVEDPYKAVSEISKYIIVNFPDVVTLGGAYDGDGDFPVKKGKGFPILNTERWAGADPGVQAVSPQVT